MSVVDMGIDPGSAAVGPADSPAVKIVPGPGPMQAGSPARLLVCLATFNERDNLPGIVAAIRGAVPGADVLVIDDGSPDGTGELADDLARADAHVRVLHRPGKLGLGTAVLDGMYHALAHGHDAFAYLDADLSHPPAELPRLLEALAGHDVVIGSRYVRGGRTENWPWPRRLLSRCVNGLVRLLFGMPVRDASGGYRVYRTELLARAHLDRVRSRGYSFFQEVLFRCHRAGARIAEVPITFANRRAGKSKVDWREAARSLGMLLWLGACYRLGGRA
jgi:dolichol-phosphate mannosyltransferase